MLRLPRFGCSTMKLTPPVLGIRPDVISPRCGSPVDRVLDLEHVGAPVGQHGARGGHEPPLGDLDDPYPLEHLVHRNPSLDGRRR